MTCYKIELFYLFIGVAICGRTYSQNTGCSRTTTKHIENWNRTTEVPSDVTTVKDKVEIKVYYETLCPFSVIFFVSQLKPALERLGSHLDIHLIPYGHAKTRRVLGRYKFTCQHGIPECYGNTVQACAIDVLRNSTRAIYFNTCLMQYTSYQSDYKYFVSVFNWCGYRENVRLQDIWKCANSKHGSVLLKGHGDETHALQPPYVPYLVIDGSTEHQDQASKNLFSTICQMLRPRPSVCFSKT